jgi:hypothetical protein
MQLLNRDVQSKVCKGFAPAFQRLVNAVDQGAFNVEDQRLTLACAAGLLKLRSAKADT